MNTIGRMTSGDYLGLLRRLAPKGVFWTALLKPGRALRTIFDAKAVELSRVHNRAADALSEIDPLKADETIETWENTLSLPSSCFIIPDALAARRELISSRFLVRSGPSEAAQLTMASRIANAAALSLAYDRPYACGEPCDEAANSEYSMFYWRIDASVETASRTRFECMMDNSAPAGREIIYDYS